MKKALIGLLALSLGATAMASDHRPVEESPELPHEIAATLRAGDRATPDSVFVNGSTDTANAETQFAVSVSKAGEGIFVVAHMDTVAVEAGNHFVSYSRSTDNGVTWTPMGQLPATTWGDGGFPQLDYDVENNRLYMVTVPLGDVDALPVFVSTDNGQTFGLAVNAAPGYNTTFNYQDQPSIAVDNSPTATRGNVYVAWNSTGNGSGSKGVRVTRSTDDGMTWVQARQWALMRLDPRLGCRSARTVPCMSATISSPAVRGPSSGPSRLMAG